MSSSLSQGLWKARSVEETMKVYADWAASYDADVTAWGYATPARIARALAARLTGQSVPVLDFGCGTGFSGQALTDAGFTTIDGTDVSVEMIAVARTRGVYRDLWQSAPGDPGTRGHNYAAITAVGVISMGAAPASMLSPVLKALGKGGVLALSYNDATLQTSEYMQALEAVLHQGLGRKVFEEYGDHLPAKNMKSAVYIIERL